MMETLAYRGLSLWGGPYWVQTVEGLEGSSARTGSDSDQPRGDGALPGRHWLSARSIVLGVDVDGRDHVGQLLEVFQPSRSVEYPLTWQVDGIDRVSFARVTDTVFSDRPGSLVRVPLKLKATDPRIYGPQHLVPLTPFDVTGAGGLDYPVDYPKQYGADVLVDATAWNGGDSDAHPTVRVRGPESGTLESFELVNVTNGSSVRIDTTVTPGQLLTVRMREWVVGDPAALIVELDGSSRYGGWTTRPDVLWLSPGSNVLRLLVLDGSPPVSAEIVYRDTWAGTRREGDV